MQRAASATRALLLCVAALRAHSQPLPCHGLEARVPSCSGSQDLQRGEKPELRGQAAAQVVGVKRPARAGHRSRRRRGGTSMRRSTAGGRCVVCPAPTRHRSPRLPAPPSQPWQTSCNPLRSPTFVGGTRQAGQRSAQSGAAVSAVAGRRLARANGASGVATSSHDTSISSSAVRHTPRVRPW